jgi:adenosylcobinamide kinase/adenosylcobinamide-phosphate guanylyltransferase
MHKITLVIGGCRSGKSRFALGLAEDSAHHSPIFIATSVPHDDEMKARVLKHQEERGDRWTTIEEPLHISDTIMQHNNREDVILVDCITLWLSNLLLGNDTAHSVERHVETLTQTLQTAECRIILVSNEVGQGIVPENKLARQFRDLAGSVNQSLAACADQVVWLVAGIPSTLKG